MTRILSIEDNYANRIMLHDFLINKGFEVIEAVDGEEGIRKAKEMKPDLIITDVGLPKKDGYEVLKELKECPETKNIPVIMISSYVAEERRDINMEIGCESYLVKPYNFKEILENVMKFVS